MMEIAKHLQNMRPSYIREILSEATTEGMISLAGGLPATDHFPMTLLAEILTKLAQQPTLFQYGETQGYRPLLDYLRQAYSLPATHDGLICTGSQQGLDLIARAFVNPGDGVAVEAPSYLGALQVFAIAQANIASIPQQSDGPDLTTLEKLFASGRIKLFYAVPDFHNPTGVCWSLSKRQAVAALCTHYGVTLIEDAPYRELRFSGEPLPMVSSLCPEQALVLRSFSKTTLPGMRLGMLTGPADWVTAVTRLKQAADLHTSVPMQAVLLQLLRDDQFPAHLQSVRDLYAERYHALATSLHQHLPNGSFDAVAGGMFVWLKLPPCDPMTLARAAVSNGVAVVPSPAFYQHSIDAPPAVRLNFSYCQPDTLDAAVQRLAQTITRGVT